MGGIWLSWLETPNRSTAVSREAFVLDNAQFSTQ
jgi:hypothetical protein